MKNTRFSTGGAPHAPDAERPGWSTTAQLWAGSMAAGIVLTALIATEDSWPAAVPDAGDKVVIEEAPMPAANVDIGSIVLKGLEGLNVVS